MQMMVGRYRPATMHSTVAAAHATTCSADLLWRAVAVGSHIPTCLFSAATGTRENGSNSGCSESTTAFQCMSLLPACRVDLLTKPAVVASLGVMDLATPRHSRSRKPHFSHSPVARTDTRHGRHQPRLEHYKNPRCPKTTPWTISDLLRAIRDNNPHYAYSIFQSIEGTNPKLIKCLPAHWFSTLIDTILNHSHDSSRNFSASKRLEYSASVLELMETLGIPNTYSGLLSAIYIYGRRGDIASADAAYCEMQQRGFTVNSCMVLMRMCQANILCGREAKGLEFFNQLLTIDRSARPYNVLAKAYFMVDHEMGMLKVIEKMLDSQTIPDSTTIAILCRFYRRSKDPATVRNHMALFKAHWGRYTPALYHIQMQVANDLCDYSAVLDLYVEMQAEKLLIGFPILEQVLLAYAGLGDMSSVWSIFSTCLISKYVISKEIRAALARTLGPLSINYDMLDLEFISIYNLIPHDQLLEHLVRGYAILGDVASVKVLIARMLETTFLKNNVHEHAMWAFFNACDASGALEYAESLESTGGKVNFDIWFAALVCATKYLPDAVPQVISHIKTTYPNESTESLYQRAKAYIDNPSKSDGL
ncbi:hypothetical protein BASA50_000163 [Batrachochytrium salamandrivorans]|uniref:Pentacotripeptide-repeat region of PRORP domain-containing protein n=1 Tax=Batrachochytrium salamandrivorans TaxID=1357716 RepID=A0ABQ8EXG3_9FUNG|nr:hypothetical protein BASA50_000163 [Batrachochytrium salamandrivorans]